MHENQRMSKDEEENIDTYTCDCCGEVFPKEKLIYGVCENCDAMICAEGSS